MGQYDIPLSMSGGFQSLADAKAHRNVMSKLLDNRNLATETADDMREIDAVELGSTPSDLYKDLAAGKGHVIILSQPEGRPVLGAELNYNPADGSTKSMVMDFGDSKLTQYGSTYKLDEGEGKEQVTTYFKFDDNRGVVSVLDPDAEVPRIFGEADPDKLTKGVLQPGVPTIIILG
jgi:hypothetical protein